MAIGSAVCLAVLAAAASQAIQGLNNASALRINPFNSSARIDSVLEALESENSDLDQAVAVAEFGGGLNPSDGRFPSLVGLLQSKAGKEEQAQQAFGRALAITPTEIQALYNSFGHALSEKDVPAALNSARLIARRWPAYWSRLEPFLPSLLSTPETLAETALVLGDTPGDRYRLIRSLSKNVATADYAIALLDQWKRDNVPLSELRPLTNTVSNALFAAKDYTRSYFLFRSLLDEEQQKVTGYIHNSRFTVQPTGNPFDWMIKSQPGATVAIGKRGLEVNFRDSPIRFEGLRQYFRLPPGEYVLNAAYSTRDLVTPKPLKLALGCAGGKVIGDLPLKTGDEADIQDAVKFTVPTTACPTVRISLVNEFAAMSWSNRFRGSLTLHNVSVERASEPES